MFSQKDVHDILICTVIPMYQIKTHFSEHLDAFEKEHRRKFFIGADTADDICTIEITPLYTKPTIERCAYEGNTAIKIKQPAKMYGALIEYDPFFFKDNIDAMIGALLCKVVRLEDMVKRVSEFNELVYHIDQWQLCHGAWNPSVSQEMAWNSGKMPDEDVLLKLMGLGLAGYCIAASRLMESQGNYRLFSEF